ncbi:MAG: FecCD family ABC transporter permease [Geitlerinemataceae cyanobacterium]
MPPSPTPSGQTSSKPWISLRRARLSLRVDRRAPLAIAILSAIALLTFLASIATGDYPISLPDTIATLFNRPANPDYAFVIGMLRIPRALAALLVGMGLAVSGTICQAIARNPLAAPGIIGINSGASLVAVIFIVVFPAAPASGLPLAAFLGSLTVALAIYLLAWDGGSSPVRLILIGISLTSLTGAVTSLLTTFGNIGDVSRALVWLIGSVYGRSWAQVGALLPWLAVFLPVSLVLARDLDALNLGDELAQGLGSRLELKRSVLTLCAVALAGASVATAGTIGFVGLMAPHLARQLVGPSHAGLLPVAGLVGACVVGLADLVGRIAFAPIELPCGAITAAVGAPYFLWLLYRNRN